MIKEFNCSAGDDPIPVSVNLQGVDILEIEVLAGAAFYNVTLAGIQ
ncbi:hypothetical protein [Paenibacillus cisolokensis]|nr:hypothetical protein [Paenibacillus cisolokensis]